MTTAEMLAALRELMTAYDAGRAAWVAQYGTDAGYDAWFTTQVRGNA